jgi:hypothetical protein
MISSNVVVVVAFLLAALSSLASQVVSARVIALLKLRHTSVWEEVMSRPDVYRLGKRIVSPARVLSAVPQLLPSLSQDSELRRAMAVLRIAQLSVALSFTVCLVAALSHWVNNRWSGP